MSSHTAYILTVGVFSKADPPTYVIKAVQQSSMMMNAARYIILPILFGPSPVLKHAETTTHIEAVGSNATHT